MLNKIIEKLNEVKEEVHSLVYQIVQANDIISQIIETSNGELKTDAIQYLEGIDEKTNNLNNNIINILALYRPEAVDLREMIAYSKITDDIQRSASYTKNFLLGYDELLQSEIDFSFLKVEINKLHNLASNALKISADMIKENKEDVLNESYNTLCELEDNTDTIFEELEQKIYDSISDSSFHKDHFKLISTIKKLEKLTDRAANIGSNIVYAENGK